MTIDRAIGLLKMAVPMKAVTISEFSDFIEAVNMAIDALEKLPSAEKAQLSGEDATFDCISRREAVDEFWKLEVELRPSAIEAVWDMLKSLPSAEPKIIHCKNCKHRDSNDCPMYYEEWIEIDEGDGYFDTDTIIHDRTTDEGFCHCAELRGNSE